MHWMGNTLKQLDLQDKSPWWPAWFQTPVQTTRDKILLAAFTEVHLNGFQAASIQNIIQNAGVTKGALYHYFESKDAIGYALLDEVFTQYIENQFIQPLLKSNDPITGLIENLTESGSQMTEEDISLGCPLDHFAQEMSPINKEFQKRINLLYMRKHEVLVDALKRGQESGNVTQDVDAESVAIMIDATLQGCMAMAKQAQSIELLMKCGQGLFDYLEQLRPEPHNVSALSGAKEMLGDD